MSKQDQKLVVTEIEPNNKAIQDSNLTVQSILQPLLRNLNLETNFEVSKKDNKTIVKVDSNNGQARTIITVENQGPLNMATVSQITKPSVQERRKIVSTLHSEGKSQTEIANITMVSQKTISNDLKKIISNKT
ncbi:winged helix-turn-helix domain-containing protein [Aliarcobacter cryaerophilus]|uniref:winged helix-turn-helix domain-containing protein n=1 Tax=Aliarcobacter cryaerophilus TaxID=28198 RepID=UPI003DA29ACD